MKDITPIEIVVLAFFARIGWEIAGLLGNGLLELVRLTIMITDRWP